jgi:hypothetical protein
MEDPDPIFVGLRQRRYPHLVAVQQSSGQSSLHDTKPVDAPEPAVEQVRALDLVRETEQLQRESWIFLGAIGLLGAACVGYLLGRIP